MWKIALRGMRGRRRDTFLLMLVITLSFTLLISTVLLHGSTQYTGQRQRMDSFGEWTGGLFGLKEAERQSVMEELSGETDPREDGIGRLRLLGTSDVFGLIGAAEEELMEMGHFKVTEGRLPEAKDEIAVEASQLATYGDGLQVGDTILVVTSVTLQKMSRSEVAQARARLIQDDPYRGEVLEKVRQQYPAEVFPMRDGKYVWPMVAYARSMQELEEPAIFTADILATILDENWELKGSLTAEDCPNGDRAYYQTYWNYLKSGFALLEYEEYEEMLDAVVSHFLQFHYDWISRTEYSGEGDDEMRSRTVTDYTGSIWYDGKPLRGLESYLKYAVMTRQAMELKREMTICGILEEYSSDWDTGNYEMPTALVSAETGHAFLEEGLYQLEPIQAAGYEVPQYLFFDEKIGLIQGSEDAEAFAATWGERFRQNELAYPEGTQATEQVLTISILAFILVATLFSVFQIFLIQMRRRVRKLALIKAIGATNRQVAKLLFWEGLFLLIPGLILGALLSAGVMAGAILLMPRFTGGELLFAFDGRMLSIGVLGGCLAVVLGMSVPGTMALRVPLTGRIQPQSSSRGGKRTKTTREVLSKKKKAVAYQPQSYRAVEQRHRRYTRGQNRMLQAIYSVLISVVLSSLLLGFLAFYEYTREVVLTDRADYEINQSYSLNAWSTAMIEEELAGIPGVERVETWRRGVGAYLWSDKLADSDLIRGFRQLLPESLRSEHVYDREIIKGLDATQPVEEGLRVNLYGVSEGSSIHQRLMAAVTEGKLDPAAYASGHQVILLVPLSHVGAEYDPEGELERYTAENLPGGTNKENRMGILLEAAGQQELTYSDLYQEYYQAESVLQPGDPIVLTVPTEDVDGSGAKLHTYYQQSVEVGAVIHYFPEVGIWPFSGSREAYAVIGSEQLMGMLYPYIETSFGEKDEWGELSISAADLDSIQKLFPTRYGEIIFSVYTDDETDKAFIEAGIRKAVDGYFFRVDGLHADSARMYNRAFKEAALVVLVAFAATLILLVVLYNMRQSRMEQERERIGILQSLGVRRRELRRAATLESLSYSIRALAVAHLVLLLILLVTSTVEMAGVALSGMEFVKYILRNRLYDYPWLAHGVICLAFVIVSWLIHCLPLRKYEKCQPVENIRSQGH